MLARLIMELESEGELNVLRSSNLQGVLMEQIDPVYADILHQSALHPVTQHLETNGNRVRWVICTVTDQAEKEVIRVLQKDSFSEFLLRNHNQKVKICRKSLEEFSEKELMDDFYNGTDNRYIHLEFITPTAFKSNGEYVIMPNLELIFRSLMKKYSLAMGDEITLDTDALEDLVTNSRIVEYRLRSVSFPLEGVRVPSFLGKLTVCCKGPATLARYARLLFRFGEFSGIGIKTGIGMGAIRLMKEGEFFERKSGKAGNRGIIA